MLVRELSAGLLPAPSGTRSSSTAMSAWNRKEQTSACTWSIISWNIWWPSTRYSTSGILLGHRAQVDALAQVVHVVEVLAPALVDRVQHDEALELAHDVGADALVRRVAGLLGLVLPARVGEDAVDQLLALDLGARAEVGGARS